MICTFSPVHSRIAIKTVDDPDSRVYGAGGLSGLLDLYTLLWNTVATATGHAVGQTVEAQLRRATTIVTGIASEMPALAFGTGPDQDRLKHYFAAHCTKGSHCHDKFVWELVKLTISSCGNALSATPMEDAIR